MGRFRLPPPPQVSLRKWHQILLGHRAQQCSADAWEILKAPLSPGWEGPKLSPRADPEAQTGGPGTPMVSLRNAARRGRSGGGLGGFIFDYQVTGALGSGPGPHPTHQTRTFSPDLQAHPLSPHRGQASPDHESSSGHRTGHQGHAA